MRRTTVFVRAIAATLCCCILAGCGSMYVDDNTDVGETLEQRVASGLSVQAKRGSKTLDITRSTPTGTRPSDVASGTWTVLVYLCGSDLETNGGAATADLGEMVGASGSENVRFVVQTGGAKRWRSNVGGNKSGRYLIQDGSIQDVGSTKAADMGDPNTLSDFIIWGLRNYPADHMGLTMWDHGGGSIAGVCFDERNGYNSLLLRELDVALSRANSTMWKKFDFVGLDACLMGTLETANVLASYADYMIASQETEPGTGWEYSSIIEYLAQHPSCTGGELGQALCDGYLESLAGRGSSTATLSVIDLSKMDDLMQDFYSFSQEMYESGSDQGTLAAMTRGIRQADSFGSNNWLEGYSNMVDLGGVVDACAATAPSASDVKHTLSDAVVYQVHGRAHARASGLSVYYPLSVRDGRELTAFQTVAANPSYLSYVDRLAHGATYNGGSAYTSYTSDSWYDSDGLWSLVMDEDTIAMLLGATRSAERSVDSRWEYLDEHSDESKVVRFAKEPQVDDKGVYWMQFSDDTVNNVASTSGLVFAQEADGSTRMLGETYEVYANWDTGEVEDGFDGKWLSLPDGQNLCLSVVESTTDEAVFTSPVRVNDKECFLRMVQDLKTGDVEVEGIWSGTGQNGLANRSCIPVEAGARLVPLYQNDDGSYREGAGYVVGDKGLQVTYDDLPIGTYSYAFSICDVYGDHMVTDTVSFEVAEDGIYFVS